VRADYDNNNTPFAFDDFYPWTTNGQRRWGSNTIDTTTVTDNMNNVITGAVATAFDSHTSADYISSEAQGATGDSGGGIWINNGGSYELAGITFAITDISDNRAEYGDSTAIMDLSSFKNEIYSVTGIPEPNSALLGGLSVAMWLLSQRRRRLL